MTDYEINKAAEEFTDQFVPENKRCCKQHSKYCGAPSSLEDVYGAFTQGAEWALNHQWISVDNSLPEYDEDVLVTNNGNGSWFTHCTNDPKVLKDKHDFALFTKKERIRYWMRIPELKVK